MRALAAAHGDAVTGDCLLWDVTGPDGARLLYATDTGPLCPETLSALATYDLVLLEETFGDLAEHDADHHDLDVLPSDAGHPPAAGRRPRADARRRHPPRPPQPADARARPSDSPPGVPRCTPTARLCARARTRSSHR